MSAVTKFDQIQDELQHTRCTENVWNLLHDYVQKLGVNEMEYHHLPPPGAIDFNDNTIIARGVSNELASKYLRRHKAFRSLFQNKISQLTTPTFWSKAIKKFELPAEHLEELINLYPASHCNGILVPIYGPHNRNGCIAFHFKDSTKRYNGTEIRELQWASQLAHQTFCEIQIKSRTNKITLTKREQEILSWVARGKSNSVIADIVGISQHTVNGHLRRIYLKTGTSNRTSAALRGLAECLIHF